MPMLQQHQLRVAGVAKIIMDNISAPLDRDNVIIACLFHDMGNIIKADLDYFPAACEPEGKEYWLKVKDGCMRQYGSDEIKATLTIAAECGLPVQAVEYISLMGFKNADKTAAASLEQKICTYADMRVTPTGVVSLAKRLAEGRERYKNKYPDSVEERAYYQAKTKFLQDIEQSIQSVCHVPLSDITEETVRPLFSTLETISL